MVLKIKIDRWGACTIQGLTPSFQKYENDIFKGNIPCPYKVEHRDSEGNLLTNKPIPLNPSGKPKLELF